MVVDRDLSPIYLIPYDRLCKSCEVIAHHNNDMARALGQKERLSATELIDLYYAQRGRCALTGWPLEWHESIKHGRRLELDHIIEQRAKQVVSNAVSGDGPTEYGKIACITNVQWVCRVANRLKEYVRCAELPFEETIFGMAYQLEQGRPLRSEANYLGAKGRREFRENFLRDAVAANPGISASELCDRLVGTKGEASYPTVIKDMKRLKLINSRKESSWSQLRKGVVSEIVKLHGTTFESKQHFVDIANSLVGPGGDFSPTQWTTDANKIGVVLTFLKSSRASPARNEVCAGDRQACLSVLREVADEGMTKESLRHELVARGAPPHLVDVIISQTCDLGAVYAHEGRLFAALNRAETAERLGVSQNRPKKWGRSDWPNQFAGPPFVKKSTKGLTYYKRHEIDEFAARRGSHPLDLSLQGQRDGCVIGGSLGGRPATVGLTERQQQVAALKADGFTVRQIGERLGISHYTVEEHVHNIRAKTKSCAGVQA